MGLIERLLWLYFLTSVNAATDECKSNVEPIVGNSTGYRRLSRSLEDLVDYTVDPCEDFYQYVCNNLFTTPDLTEILRRHGWKRRGLHEEMYISLKREEYSMLESPDFEDSRSMKAVQRYYKRCMSSEREWSSTNGPIAFVLRKIRQYGGFPIIGDRLQQEDVNDVTDLLAYFNRGFTTTVSLVPHFERTVASIGNSMYLSFVPKQNIISRLSDNSVYLSRERMERTPEFRFFMNIVRRICAYTRTCNGKTVKKHVLELSTFTLVVNGLAMEYVQKDEDGRCSGVTTLREVDNMIVLVNWTNYLNKIRPRNAMPITSDMKVNFCDEEYFRRLDLLLRTASKRVTTNYVIMMYILAWIEHLGDDYRSIAEKYAHEVNAQFPPKEEFCATQTWDMYGFSIMMAMFARKNNGRKIEKHATQITNDIIVEFEHLLNNNTWMDKDSKQALLLKLRNMKKFIAYEDEHFDLKAFDSLLEDYIQEEDFEEKSFLEIKEKFGRLTMDEMFRCLSECKAGVKHSRPFGDIADPNSRVFLNMIEILPGTFHYPYYGATFPMSFNYGGIGTVIGHEIMHNFNLHGLRFDAKAVQNLRWLEGTWFDQYFERALCLQEHYNNSEVLFYENRKAIKTNLKNDASQTWEEDLVDNEGIKLSFRAYRTYLEKHGSEARLADKKDLSSDQVFFIGWALNHCAVYTEEGLEYYLKSDKHSVGPLRVNKVVANQPEFAEAFHCSPKKQLNPEKRCSVY